MRTWAFGVQTAKEQTPKAAYFIHDSLLDACTTLFSLSEQFLHIGNLL